MYKKVSEVRVKRHLQPDGRVGSRVPLVLDGLGREVKPKTFNVALEPNSRNPDLRGFDAFEEPAAAETMGVFEVEAIGEP